MLSASTLPMSGIVLSKSWDQTNSRFRRTVVMGQVGLSFYQVKAALIQMVLELGYTVEVREGSHEQIFPLLGTGKIDLPGQTHLN
ncbi:hypothetical protein [Nostoc sp.]|uniref:hypothetical protein n=1 Tax=Nostoc sp. TaxID=1180 RepID=UPI0035934119